MACMERRRETTLETLQIQVDELEKVMTLVARVLMKKGVYNAKDVAAEYKQILNEKAAVINKVNLEGTIEVANV